MEIPGHALTIHMNHVRTVDSNQAELNQRPITYRPLLERFLKGALTLFSNSFFFVDKNQWYKYGTTTTVQLLYNVQLYNWLQCTTIQLTTAEVQLSASHVKTAEYKYLHCMKSREWLKDVSWTAGHESPQLSKETKRRLRIYQWIYSLYITCELILTL